MSSLLEINIMNLLIEKDEKGMAMLYDYYGDALYGIAYKITRDEELAKDVLQEGLVKIWKKAHTYDAEKARLFTWLYRIIRNTAIDKVRNANIKEEQEIQLDISNVYNVGVDAIKPEHIDVEKHLASLDAKYQIILDALFFKGMTQQEASEALDVPLGTVKSRLKIGLRELRKIFNTNI
ncbi:RNA polymerase sigma factor [Sinomicrobium weinanense]|uniref:RNA polymerase sigma factor n=1 Tax=Sinomicrobium weinanense TaxID=2842200 RepID=A0A926JRH0_9FLAO|nr:RNA polymerase sigma factor [Sinomicrobium weinanense]MBC9796093.1 RNA polymerase sigma factor [Sinomicrobium weinanense]MBU3124762.1 RNA polymerase sigma factor [Sinomicrobium weinanense]